MDPKTERLQKHMAAFMDATKQRTKFQWWLMVSLMVLTAPLLVVGFVVGMVWIGFRTGMKLAQELWNWL